MRKGLLFGSLFLAFLSGGTAVSASEQRPRPAQFVKLVDCRSITDSTARLACYDREVAAIEQAERDQEIVLFDKEQVKSARRTLFGLTLPTFDIFKNAEGTGEGFTNIEAKIKQVNRNAIGKWIFTLDDGAQWVQIDSRELVSDPRPEQTIAIRRASMGSFLANVNGQIAIRVRRIL